MKGTIKTRREFQTVYEHGEKAIGQHLVLFGLDREAAGERLGVGPTDEPLIGVVASRKVGNAIARNRAKRVIRAACRESMADLPTGSRVVIVARRNLITAGMRTPQIARELERLLGRLSTTFRGSKS